MAENEIPRRCYLERMTPAERAIWDAKEVIEGLPADTRLTQAVILLAEAQDRVADFVDGKDLHEGKILSIGYTVPGVK